MPREVKSRVVLDEVDRALLKELQVDGRLSNAKLAQAVGLSPTATRIRLKRLRDSGVVEIVAVVDPSLIGFDVEAMVGVNVEGDVMAVAVALGEVPEIINVMVTAGRFDLMVDILCHTNRDLERLVRENIRSTPGVTSIETFLYLLTTKDSYNWCSI